MNTSRNVHSKGSYSDYYRTHPQVLISNGLTGNWVDTGIPTINGGHRLLRRFTWKVAYQKIQKCQEKVERGLSYLVRNVLFLTSTKMSPPGNGKGWRGER